MSYDQLIRDAGSDAAQVETIYQSAIRAGEATAFADAIEAAYEAEPANLLYAAWHFRLAQVAQPAQPAPSRVVAWRIALPLALLNGLALWLLSDQRLSVSVGGSNTMPEILLLAAPISAVAVLVFLARACNEGWHRLVMPIGLMALLTAYAFLVQHRVVPNAFQQQYMTLMVGNLAAVALGAVALYVLWPRRQPEQAFAFLVKVLEVVVIGGLFGIALAMFAGISIGLFSAMGIDPPEAILRLFVAGGAGLVPVIAVAIAYDPRVAPIQQSFEEGLSKLIRMLMRFVLPLALVVLVTYVILIPFKFRGPFENRDVLIIYNAMLFAVVAMLLGATPVTDTELDDRARTWLRRGMMVVAALAIVVGLHALIAIVSRTHSYAITPNRLTFIGWNVINLGLLAALLFAQLRSRGGRWLPGTHRTFAGGMVPYGVWVLATIVVLPLLFASPPKGTATLPESIKYWVEEEPGPILLTCEGRPEVYLMQDGQKRWIKDIPTFTAEGFDWSQVRYVTCDDIQHVPDGTPIPPDAGQPPQP
jgi:hypothetical protein